MNFKKLDNVPEIKPIQSMQIDSFDYTYKNIFGSPFFILFIMWMRGSGKWTLIYNLLEKIVWNKTDVHLFWCTANTDDTLIKMQKKLKKYRINFELHEDLNYEADKSDIMCFNDILHKIYFETKTEIEREIENGKKYKKIFAKKILIFDDFSQYLRTNKYIDVLAKQGRHLHIIMIIASQTYTDLMPGVRQNLSNFIFFKNVGINKLKQIFEEKIAGYIKTFDEFVNLYDTVTAKKFDFLFIDFVSNEFRKNLNYLIDMSVYEH